MASRKDIYTSVLEAVSLLPAVRTADANGTGVDLRDFPAGGVLLMASIGAPGITLTTSNKIQFRAEECDDDATYTPVAAGDLLDHSTSGLLAAGTNGEFGNAQDGTTGNNGSQIVTAGYRGTKRYVRIVADFSGTHGTGTPLSAMVLRSQPNLAPTR